MITIERKINKETLEETWLVIHNSYLEKEYSSKDEALICLKELKEELICID